MQQARRWLRPVRPLCADDASSTAPTTRSGSGRVVGADRKSTRLNSSHTEIYTLSLHDALPIYAAGPQVVASGTALVRGRRLQHGPHHSVRFRQSGGGRSEEHTSELQSHRDLHSFPTRRSSDLCSRPAGGCVRYGPCARTTPPARPPPLGPVPAEWWG